MDFSALLEKLESRGIALPHDAISKINELTGSKLDEYDDVTGYINSILPDNESLERIDDEITKVEREIAATQTELETRLTDFCAAPDFCSQTCDSTLSTLNEVIEKIKFLHAQASKSEDIVLEATRDIKQLENAKKNLSSSISALSHFQILSNGVQELRENLENWDLLSVSKLLPKLTAVQETFSDFRNVPRVAEVLMDFSVTKEQVRERLLREFQQSCSLVFEEHVPVSPKVMSCTTILSAHEFSLKEELVQIFLENILKDYACTFSDELECSWLDQVDRRVEWLKAALVAYDEVYNMWFPYSWEVDHRLSAEFCALTNAGLSRVMAARCSEIDCKLLIFALDKIISLEDFLADRFEHASSGSDFSGLVSTAFKKHFYIYTEFQDKNIAALVAAFGTVFRRDGLFALFDSSSLFEMSSEDRLLKLADVGLNSRTILVLPAANELFRYFKRCLVHFSKLRRVGHLNDLVVIFKKHLFEFAQNILEPSLPKFNPRYTNEYVQYIDALKVYCCVIVTAAYCAETIEQLGAKVGSLDPYNSEAFIPVTTRYRSIMQTGIAFLVQSVEQALEPGFASLTRIAWATYSNVGDQSPYISQFGRILEEHFSAIRNFLHKNEPQFCAFCVHFANVFTPKYTEAVFAVNSPVLSSGVEQLLLDTQVLKNFLLSLPSTGGEGAKASREYTNMVKSNMHRLEMMLKLVLTPHRPFDEFVDRFLTLVENPTLEDFKRVLALKTLQKGEHNMAISSYNMFKKLKEQS